jgi:hypothetical protein
MLHVYFLFLRSVDHGTAPRLPQDALGGKTYRVRGNPSPSGNGRVSDQVAENCTERVGEGSLDSLP